MKKNRKMSLTLAAALALTALTACGSMSASAAIDAAAAKQIAADHLGVNVSDLKVLECERDDGKYELEVLVGDVKYDFEIGASSGKVLEVDRDRRDRDTISNIRMMLSITASMIITAFTLPLINYVAQITGKEQLSWVLVTSGYAIVSVFILLNTYATCTERVQAAPQTKKENIPFWKSFKITFTNRYFLIALGLMIAYTAYQVIIGTDLTYYCQYVLGDANLVMPLSSAEKVCTIIGIALLPKLLPRYGKRNLICFGCALGVVGQLLFLLNITSVPLGVVSCIIRGFGIAPFYGVQYSLPGDAIEYGHWKHGLRVEGLMFSSMSMGQKAGSGFTSAIMGGILSMAAFDGLKATAAEQTVEAIVTIKAFYLYVPIVLWVIMFLIAACYKLDKAYDKMMHELLEREGKSAEVH